MIMKIRIAIISLMLMALMPTHSKADTRDGEWGLKARVGYQIGGTAPIGIPATIRSIGKYRLTPSLMTGVSANLPIQSNWGLQIGLLFENKAMDAEATTKSYHMEVKKGESMLEGVYTGHIRQKVTEWMFTLPVQATYALGEKVTLKAGPYLSVLVSKDFSGYVYDGYLRQGNPTGPKVSMGTNEDERATYDFSDDMRNLQVGVGVGADWQVSRCIGLSADLNWGLNGIFKSDFNTVEQTLYPIYGTIGVFYRIK